jgi:serine/threonine protein kinase
MIPAYEASRIEKRTWAATPDLETIKDAYAISEFPTIEPIQCFHADEIQDEYILVKSIVLKRISFKNLDNNEFSRFVNEVTHTLNELHLANIVHGDVRLANLLVNESSPGQKYQLSDFELSHRISDRVVISWFHPCNGSALVPEHDRFQLLLVLLEMKDIRCVQKDKKIEQQRSLMDKLKSKIIDGNPSCWTTIHNFMNPRIENQIE